MGSDVGLIGLGVMGESLALNMASRGYRVSVYNRTYEKTRAFTSGRGAGRGIHGYRELGEFVSSLSRPRKILIFVKAGSPVDEVIASLRGHLEKGDIVMDCGNSHFRDSDRRHAELSSIGLGFLGLGVSGGEEGALKGPSIMAGGERWAYEEAGPLLREIAARKDGSECLAYFGPGGAGHLVKTIHNGIEYAMMQGIAEAYSLLSSAGKTSPEIGRLFAEWAAGDLSSFLMEAAARVLTYREEGDEKPLVELILDEAEQKGTGRWAGQVSLELGSPATCIDEAVYSRSISSLRDERAWAARRAKRLGGRRIDGAQAASMSRDMLYPTFLISYMQGLTTLHQASRQMGYDELRVSEAARVWRAGCIIRSRLVEEIYEALSGRSEPPGVVILERFSDEVGRRLAGWAGFVSEAALRGIPAPVSASALNYYYSYTSERLPANLIQAMRDYFGAHTFRRVDRDGSHHSSWGRVIDAQPT